MEKKKWKKPEIVVVDLKEFEKEIIAKARSGCSGQCWVGCSCVWVIVNNS